MCKIALLCVPALKSKRGRRIDFVCLTFILQFEDTKDKRFALFWISLSPSPFRCCTKVIILRWSASTILNRNGRIWGYIQVFQLDCEFQEKKSILSITHFRSCAHFYKDFNGLIHNNCCLSKLNWIFLRQFNNWNILTPILWKYDLILVVIGTYWRSWKI